MNISPVSCATVKVSPAVTGITPSDSSTAPSLGSVLIVTVSCEDEKFGSVGIGMPIGAAPLLGATVNVELVVTGGVVFEPIDNVAASQVLSP